MSITDELRTEARGFGEHLYTSEQAHLLLAIADRIDAEHKDAVRKKAARMLTKTSEYMNDDDLAEIGLVRLPVDADGEHIRIGDVMEGVDKYDSLKKVMGKVITVSFESDGTVDVAIQAWNSDGKSWHRAYLDPNASIYRHYHAPTVEDVLREFASRWDEPMRYGRDELVEQFAAKLQLREDA